MNTPNRITICRIFLAIVLILLLIFPFYKINFYFPTFVVSDNGVIVDSKYLIAGIIFLLAALTDFLDGFIARRYNMVTDLGKVLDSIADKILVNGVLVILAVENQLSVIVPVVIILRDIIVDSIKMVVGSKIGAVAASWTGKLKTVFMLIGLTLLFFGNLPFEVWNLRVAEFLILTATVLSVVSGVQYYINNKKYFLEEK